MSRAIQIIQADMKQHAHFGGCAFTYTDEQIRSALAAVGIDLEDLFVSPAFLWGLALEDLCEKALKQ